MDTLVINKEFHSMKFKPREYQLKLGNSVKSYNYDKKILIHLLTGMGKTKLSFYIMDELLKEKNFIFIVPRINLSIQTFAEREGLGYIQGAKSKNLNARVIIATAQTLVNRINKGKIDLSRFDYFIMDEIQALKYTPTTDYNKMGIFQKIEHKKSQHTKIIGLSATPFKGDGSPLEGWGKEDCEVFGEEYDFDYAVRNGYLSDVLIRQVQNIDESDLRISTSSGDFTESSVKEMLKHNKELDIVNSCIPYIVGKTAVFASNIEHCNSITNEFKELGYAVESMHSKGANPKDALKRFNAGETKILVTVDMLSFGQDVKNLETLILARAIGSHSVFKQVIGRGLRPAEGKTLCHILDCMGNIERLGHPFDKVEAPATRESKKESIYCKECESKKPLLLINKQDVEEFEVCRVTKKCIECGDETEQLLPMPMQECNACGITFKVGKIYTLNSKVLTDCPCGNTIVIEETTPKEMIISFRDRDEAIRKILIELENRFKDDVQFIDEFKVAFSIFSTHCKLSDLGSIMNYVLKLKNNYSDESIRKLVPRMIEATRKHNGSPRHRFIQVFMTLQDEVNYEFIDFLFNNTREEEYDSLFILFNKIREQINRKAKANNTLPRQTIIKFKQLKSLAVRNFKHLKGK